jgi:hypothetical protein
MSYLENSSQASAPLLTKTSSFYPLDKSYGLENQLKDIDLSGLEDDLDEIYVKSSSQSLHSRRLRKYKDTREACGD